MTMQSVLLLVLWTVLVDTPAANRDDLIVSFRTFEPVDVHEKVLCNALDRESIECSLRPRSAHARDIPTDFVVLIPSHRNVASVVSSLSFVRGVYADASSAPRKPHTLERSRRWNPSTRGGKLHAFSAGDLWARGYTGSGVKVAVFDTGLVKQFSGLANVLEQTDWTGEGVQKDVVGHGTFVAGLLAGRHPHCPGIAPGVELYAMRLFTGKQVSYTSWFLDAFNYALHIGVDVLNLSIGGPDFADEPFVDKVNELTAAGIIIVSAIGNDGPRWGTLNNPGDMLDVVGVGGVEPDGSIASFSSRGATAHNFRDTRRKTGRVKPDIVTYARNLVAPSNKDVATCRTLSGTSVASPIVSGAIALVISAIPRERRRRVVNPASVKRALMQSAKQLSDSSMYEQGAGIMDVNVFVDVMLQIDAEFVAFERARSEFGFTASESAGQHFLVSSEHSVSDVTFRSPRQPSTLFPGPNAYIFPEYIDMTTDDCGLMWPHCAQPMFIGGDWQTLNISILNSAGVNGRVADVTWMPFTNGDMLEVAVSLPERFWPWSAGLGIHLRAIGDDVEDVKIVEGKFIVTVITNDAHSSVELPVRTEIVPRPPRNRRLLWDMFHSIQYPPGYVPRDSLESDKKDMLDWLGDSPFSNYRRLFKVLRRRGYFVDILDRPLSCIGLELGKKYGTLLLLDSEDYFFESERLAVRNAVVNDGIALIVAAEWYNTSIMEDIKFNDDNTRSRWTPVVGGGSTDALNKLLASFGIAFGNQVVSGDVEVGSLTYRIDSGAPIVAFPSHGELVKAELKVRQTSKMAKEDGGNRVDRFGVLGIGFFGRGTIVAICDSHMVDGASPGGASTAGIRLFLRLLRHVTRPHAQRLRPLFRFSVVLKSPLLQAQPTFDPLSTTAFALFLPHSRVLAENARLDNLAEQDYRPLCNMFDSRMFKPRVIEPRRNESFTIRTKPHATLVGSEDKYFANLNVNVQVERASFGSDGFVTWKIEHSLPRMLFVCVAWIGIAVGVIFMLVALFAPRRKRITEMRTRPDLKPLRWRKFSWNSIKKRVAGNDRDD